MAGYSGTPLAKKLGFKPGMRIRIGKVDPGVLAELTDAVAECEIDKNGKSPLDLILLTTKNHNELKRDFPVWKTRLAPAGGLWVSWPKKSSGVPSDLDENKVRALGLAIGLVDVKVCAISDVWSGLKFVIPVKDRPKK